MVRQNRRITASAVTVVMVLLAGTFGQVLGATEAQGAVVVRAALPPGSIKNVLVIDLENESFSNTFGPTSPATYLNQTLVPKGELLDNYYATGHVSLDNYIAQISGQAPTPMTNSDCSGQYVNVAPGTDDPNSSTYPGQVDGNGCVYPAPTATTNGAPTIADQLDAASPPNPVTHVASWRGYAEDMGNDPARDGEQPTRSVAPTVRTRPWAARTIPNPPRRPTSTPRGTTHSCFSTPLSTTALNVMPTWSLKVR